MCVWLPRVKFRDFRHETTKPPLGVFAKSCRKLRFHVLRGLLFFSFGVNASKLACVHALCLLARSHSWRAQPCACFHELTRGSPLGHGAPIQGCLRKQIQMIFERYLGSALFVSSKLNGCENQNTAFRTGGPEEGVCYETTRFFSSDISFIFSCIWCGRSLKTSI